MQVNKNDQDLISRYLLGQLEGKDLQQFTLRLLRDKSLQKEVDANRLLMKTLWHTNQQANGQTDNEGPSKWWWMLPVVLVFGGLLFFWPPNVQPPPVPQNSAPATETPANPVENTESEVLPIEEVPTETTPPPTEVPAPTKAPQKALPIAANFEPNPMLDVLIDNPTRATTLQLSITEPQAGATLTLKNKTHPFTVSGQVTLVDPDAETPVLVCHLFSNKEADFENFTPIFTQTLTLNNTSGKEYNFSFQRKLSDVSPGLYYLMIEGEEELIYLKKVFLQ